MHVSASQEHLWHQAMTTLSTSCGGSAHRRSSGSCPSFCTGHTIGSQQEDSFEEPQVVTTWFISRTRWLHVRTPESVDGRGRHVQLVARGGDQPRSSKGASQHFQGVDHGQTHCVDQEGWRRARDRHGLLNATIDRQNSGEAARCHRRQSQCHRVGACDHVLWVAMLGRLARMPNAKALLPFVLLSYAEPSKYDWHDDEGRRRTVTQAEGGEQGDTLMPLLFSIGIQSALEEVSQSLLVGGILGRLVFVVRAWEGEAFVRFGRGIVAQARGHPTSPGQDTRVEQKRHCS